MQTNLRKFGRDHNLSKILDDIYPPTNDIYPQISWDGIFTYTCIAKFQANVHILDFVFIHNLNNTRTRNKRIRARSLFILL